MSHCGCKRAAAGALKNAGRSARVILFSFCLMAAVFDEAVPAAASGPQDENAGAAATDVLIGGDPHKRYFLIQNADAEPPPEGFGLVIVLPGGDGGADFLPFVQRIFANALAGDYVAAQPVAVRWTEDQKIVWPTRASTAEGAAFTTEDFAAAVKKDVAGRVPLDESRVFILAWSSGGPAAYATLLQDDPPAEGAYIAMSVFHPQGLALEAAGGRAFFLDHSPEDETCPFWHARKAEAALARLGAATELSEYAGGHGWHGDVYGRLRTGFEWLEKNAGGAKAGGEKPGRKQKTPLVFNGGFEDGAGGWLVVNNSGRLRVGSDEKQRKEGKKSLRIDKTGGPPFDLLRNDVYGLPGGRRVRLSAAIKAEDVGRAILKLFLYDAAGEPLGEDVDAFVASGSFSNWKTVEKTFDVPEGAASAAVMFLMIQEGTVWLDDVQLQMVR